MADLLKDMATLAARIDKLIVQVGTKAQPVVSDNLRPDQSEMLLTLLQSNRLMMQAMQSSLLGECRAEKPYKPLQPIIDEYGEFKWCCTHDNPHCT